jgi:hypothetical protein
MRRAQFGFYEATHADPSRRAGRGPSRADAGVLGAMTAAPLWICVHEAGHAAVYATLTAALPSERDARVLRLAVSEEWGKVTHVSRVGPAHLDAMRAVGGFAAFVLHEHGMEVDTDLQAGFAADIMAGAPGLAQDWADARKSIERLHATDPVAELLHAWRAAVAIVRENWTAVETIAEILQASGTLTGDEFAALWRELAAPPSRDTVAMLRGLAARSMVSTP